jgi:hypothetical protein
MPPEGKLEERWDPNRRSYHLSCMHFGARGSDKKFQPAAHFLVREVQQHAHMEGIVSLPAP